MSEPLGIIYPPPELKGIVDSTARYVARNGGAFEERIKREHKDKPKFSFLFQNDPFNAYYQHKVKEIKASSLGSLEKSIDKSSPPQEKTKQDNDTSGPDVQENVERSELQSAPDDKSDHGSNKDPNDDPGEKKILEYDQDDRKPDSHDSGSQDLDEGPKMRMRLTEYMEEKNIRLEKPPSLNYLATPAPSLTYMENDIIKLTAQFIATHGRSFLLELVRREHNNIEFDFIKPQHGQFNYMTNLIMQYALIRNQPLDIIEQLEQDSTSQKHVLDKIKMRAEWDRMLELEKKKKEEAEEQEKILYSQIDWQDFVIVETIDYDTNERGEFPPTTADQVGTRLLLQQRLEETRHVPEEMDIDMEMDSEGEESGNEEDLQPIEKNPSPNEQFAVPIQVQQAHENIPIKRDYNPKANAKTASQAGNYFISPITNERIPADKIHEHVRFNLSDPKHLEKKDQMLKEKMNEETVFASGSQIQNSLKSLAECRTDIFGMDDQETLIGKRIGEEEQTQIKDDRFIWDGHKSSLKKMKPG